MKVQEVLAEDFNNTALFALYEELDKLGVDAFVSKRQGILVISKIVVKKESRNEGKGTKAMELICDFADKQDMPVALTPTNDFGGTVSKLKVFYKRFGFVDNKGKNKVFETTESLIRLPKGKKA